MDLKQIGKFEIISKLGEGGFGAVFLAEDTKLKRNVALKVLHPQVASDEMLAAYFDREAMAMARLKHVNIVDVYDYDQKDGISYIVMEYVAGTTLDRMLKDRGLLTLEQSVPVFQQVLAALAYAHEHGIIHRDIKPSNIMVTPSGLVKITDFGIAKVAGSAKLTRTGTGAGSLLYMSPEQIKGKDIDNRSDLYSVGVTLYQVAAGRTPFEADSDYEIMTGHLEHAPPTPTKFNKEVPAELEKLILKSLDKKPEKRFQSAAEMSAALGNLKSPSGKSSPDRTIAQPNAADQKTVRTPLPEIHKKVEEKKGSASKGKIAALSIAAVVVVVAIWFFTQGGDEQSAQQISNYSDSLNLALDYFQRETYDSAEIYLSRLTSSQSGSPEDRTRVAQSRAQIRLQKNDETSARQILSDLFAEQPEAVISGSDKVISIWNELKIPSTVTSAGSLSVSVDNFQEFQPVTVNVDGKSQPYQGTPLNFSDLKPGRHEVKIEGDGAKPHRESVEIGSGITSKNFALTPQPPTQTGSVVITVANSKFFEPVKIIFDGKNETYANVPMTYTEIEAGMHELTIITDVGRLADQISVNGDVVSRTYTLSQNAFSKLTVSPRVENDPDDFPPAQVIIDNERVEDRATPFVGKFMNGPHKVWIEHKNYVTVGKPKFVLLNSDTAIEFVLRKK